MPKPFADNMRFVEGGLFMSRLEDSLHDVITAVDAGAKTGELIMKIKIRKVGAAMGVTGEITTKLPKEKVEESILYPTVDGNLSTQHPKQQSLALTTTEDDRPTALRQA